MISFIQNRSLISPQLVHERGICFFQISIAIEIISNELPLLKKSSNYCAYIKLSMQTNIYNFRLNFVLIQVVLDHELFMKVEELSSSFPYPPRTAQLYFQNFRYNVQNKVIMLRIFHFECVATMFFMPYSLCRSSCLQHSCLLLFMT